MPFTPRPTHRKANSQRRAPRVRPNLARLEDRTVPSTVWTVDDNHAQLPSANFTTIHDAINAAAAGDTIKVYAGTYTEQVVVPSTKSNLNIVAVGPQSQVKIVAPATFADPTEAVVHVAGAAHVGIHGFTINGGGTSVAGPLFGVLVDQGGSADVTDNRITGIRNHTPDLLLQAVAVQFGQATPAGVFLSAGSGTAARNLIDNYEKGGIIVVGTGSNAVIEANRVLGAGPTNVIAQNGIEVADGATATVRGNTVLGNKFTGTSAEGVGILVYQSSNVTVQGNTAIGNDEGILLFADDPAKAVINSRVTGNVTLNNTFNGIGLFNANNDVVENNVASFNGFDGINLEQATGDRVAGNTTLFNGRYGIALEATATGDTVVNNRATNNVEADLFDGSTGGGTAGTANTYLNDRADTALPTALASTHQRGHEGHDHGHANRHHVHPGHHGDDDDHGGDD